MENGITIVRANDKYLFQQQKEAGTNLVRAGERQLPLFYEFIVARWRREGGTDMEYRKFDTAFLVRLDPGEEICEQLLALAQKEGIQLAQISGLGAVNSLTVGVFDTQTKEYHANTFEGPYEIVSLTGTLTTKDGAPYLHAHFAAGDAKGHVVGGHLNRAVISATAEIVLNLIPGTVGRKFSEEIGLNLFDFQ